MKKKKKKKKLKKIVGRLLCKPGKLYMNGTVIQVIENSRQYLLLRTDIFQKTVVGSS